MSAVSWRQDGCAAGTQITRCKNQDRPGGFTSVKRGPPAVVAVEIAGITLVDSPRVENYGGNIIDCGGIAVGIGHKFQGTDDVGIKFGSDDLEEMVSGNPLGAGRNTDGITIGMTNHETGVHGSQIVGIHREIGAAAVGQVEPAFAGRSCIPTPTAGQGCVCPVDTRIHDSHDLAGAIDPQLVPNFVNSQGLQAIAEICRCSGSWFGSSALVGIDGALDHEVCFNFYHVLAYRERSQNRGGTLHQNSVDEPVGRESFDAAGGLFNGQFSKKVGLGTESGFLEGPNHNFVPLREGRPCLPEFKIQIGDIHLLLKDDKGTDRHILGRPVDLLLQPWRKDILPGRSGPGGEHHGYQNGKGNDSSSHWTGPFWCAGGRFL